MWSEGLRALEFFGEVWEGVEGGFRVGEGGGSGEEGGWEGVIGPMGGDLASVERGSC